MDLETRRHIDMVAEGLRGDVQKLAEALAALSETFDRGFAGLKDEFAQGRTLIAKTLDELHEPP